MNNNNMPRVPCYYRCRLSLYLILLVLLHIMVSMFCVVTALLPPLLYCWIDSSSTRRQQRQQRQRGRQWSPSSLLRKTTTTTTTRMVVPTFWFLSQREHPVLTIFSGKKKHQSLVVQFLQHSSTTSTEEKEVTTGTTTTTTARNNTTNSRLTPTTITTTRRRRRRRHSSGRKSSSVVRITDMTDLPAFHLLVEILESELDLNNSHVLVEQMAHRSPHLLKMAQNNQTRMLLRNRIAFLRRTLNLTKTELQRITTPGPQVLELDSHTTLAPKLEFLQHYVLGTQSTTAELSCFLLRSPLVLSLSVERNLKPKFQYLIDHVFEGNVTAFQIAVHRFPSQMMTASLQNRIIPRIQALLHQRRKPSACLNQLFNFRKEKFDDWLCGGDGGGCGGDGGVDGGQGGVDLILSMERIVRKPRGERMDRYKSYLIEELGLNHSQVQTLLDKAPTNLAESESALQVQLLRNALNLTSEQVVKIFRNNPSVFRYNMEDLIARKVAFLRDKVFDGDEEATRTAIVRDPKVLIRSIETMQCKIQYFHLLLNGHVEGVRRIIRTCPQVLGFSIVDKVQPTMTFLTDQVFDGDLTRCRQFVVKQPSIWNKSIEKNLKPKVDYLQRVVFCGDQESFMESILRNPAILATYSLENRIRPRVEVMLEAGLEPATYVASTPLVLTDDKFELWLTNKVAKLENNDK